MVVIMAETRKIKFKCRGKNLAQLRYFLKENGMTVLFDVEMLSKINQEYIPPKHKFSRV